MKRLKQRKPYWCGPACIAMAVAWWYNWTIPYKDSHRAQAMAAVAGTTSKGTSIAGLKRALKFAKIPYQTLSGPVYPTFERPTGMILYDAKQDHWVFAASNLTPYGWLLFDPLAKSATPVQYSVMELVDKYFPSTGYCLFFSK